jgi:acetyl-CoA carboxylase biotin carboxyl carrier protein
LNIDLEELAAVVRLLREAEFSEFRYAKGDVSLVVRRGELSVNGDDHLQASANARSPQRPAGEASRSAPPPMPLKPAPAAAPPVAPAPVSRVAAAEPAGAQGPSSIVKAPLLGSFYGAPKPGEPAFVKVGDRVEANTVVCIIEVMKLMNSVEAGVAGVISAIHAADGELVEHGQPLFTIRSAEPA